jgi:adenylate kinase family enzyme
MLRIAKYNFSKKMNNMKPIVLMIGAPGVGKGTYSRMLSREFKIKEFSTGDELRRLSSNNEVNPEMNEIKEIIRQGILNRDIRQASR